MATKHDTLGTAAAATWERIIRDCCSPKVRQSTYIPPEAADRLSPTILDLLTIDRRGSRQKGA